MPLFRIRNTILMLLICGCLSCGGNGGVEPGAPAPQPAPAPEAERSAAWLRLEQQPGTPGVNHDPARIMLVYKSGASLPAGWSRPQPSTSASAAAQPNDMLRRNRQYEALTDALAQRYGLKILRQVYIGELNFASFALPEAGDAALLARIRSEAASMLQSAIFVPLKRANFTPNDPDYTLGPSGPQWSHWKVRCGAAWDFTRGDSSVIVAVVDTGVRLTHEELSAKVINPQTEFPTAFCDIVNNDKSIEDSDGHGTFIAGMICAEQNNSRTICGVAPLCRVLPLKISNNSGFATIDDLISGALLGGELGARVVNYSWGGLDDIPAEEQMVNQLTADGVLFVCAAGNDATSFDEYPSAFTNAFSVGSTNEVDFSSDFSNWGASVDIAAPGESLKSASHLGNTAYDADGIGTSFAAPMVAAAAGLLWSIDPGLTRAEVRNALEDNGPLADGFLLPIRRLDVAAAIESVAGDIVPSVALLLPAARTSAGTVADASLLPVSVVGATNVSRVVYTLDALPAGPGPEDRSAESTSGGSFAAQLGLDGLPNQVATLSAEYFSVSQNSGTIESTPIWVFNQRGDVNADGAVDMTDIIALSAMMGLTDSHENFRGYADCDMNGLINEADASAVGYFFGTGVVAPVISSVIPQTGITGSQLSMTALLTGGGLLDYAWDFGGGATPNTSSNPAPTITLGAPGNYSATLSVSGAAGSDEYQFTLEVEARPGPTASFAASPSIGLPPLNPDFDASASASPGGSIEQYQWSWDGDAVFEETSTSPLASHEFTELGEYTVRLRVTDDQNATAETTKLVKVIEGLGFDEFGTTLLGPFGSRNSASSMRFGVCEISGRPAAIWIFDDDDTGACYVAVAKVDAPESLEDWRVDIVDEGTFLDGLGATASICDHGGEAAFLFGVDVPMQVLRYGCYSGDSFTLHDLPGNLDHGCIGIIGGKPAVMAGRNEQTYFNALVEQPDAAADWNQTAITAPGLDLSVPYGYPFQLREIDGRAMFEYEGGDSGNWKMCFATDDPPGGNDWGSYTWEGDHIGSDMNGHLFIDEGMPAVLYTLDNGSEVLYYSKATSLSPDTAGEWITHVPHADYKRIKSAVSLDGLPAFVSGQVVIVATTPSPTGPADWQVLPEVDGFVGGHLLCHGGLPAILATTNEGVEYRYPLP